MQTPGRPRTEHPGALRNSCVLRRVQNWERVALRGREGSRTIQRIRAYCEYLHAGGIELCL